MANLTVRINERAHRVLKTLSQSTGQPMPELLDEGIEAYRRRLFLEGLNQDFAALRSDKAEWADEVAERAAWDAALGDGLED